MFNFDKNSNMELGLDLDSLVNNMNLSQNEMKEISKNSGGFGGQSQKMNVNANFANFVRDNGVDQNTMNNIRVNDNKQKFSHNQDKLDRLENPDIVNSIEEQILED